MRCNGNICISGQSHGRSQSGLKLTFAHEVLRILAKEAWTTICLLASGVELYGSVKSCATQVILALCSLAPCRIATFVLVCLVTKDSLCMAPR